ncbi:MAG: indolepyruvate ferredoxin oxidoreductase subunit alpha [Oscillospiraceae bacterium]|nr:indolepyruvate ferredoxin oxidoreductase subunit alpha [Oscillospiraceae bacterium]
MKTLMLGNEAAARGLYEAGCAVASSYPGTPSTEITESLAEYDGIYAEWAPNEKVALETAFGASFAGRRAFCGMKHVGLNVAADPLFTISYTGVNAGLVIAVADDPGMHSSQNEQDSRHYAVAAKLPMLEPADSSECLEFAKYAYELSERFDTPVMLRMCTRIAHSRSVVETGERAEPPVSEYVKRAEKYVMMPGNARLRHPEVERRMAELGRLADDTFLNRIETGDRRLGIITSGTAYQYAREVFGGDASILKLGLVNPLPGKLILDFAASVERLAVIEELDPVIENHCKRLGLRVEGKSIFPAVGEFSQNLVASVLGRPAPSGRTFGEPIPARPPVMCAGCPHRGVFFTLARAKVAVIGDIGCYTLGASPPLHAMDSTVCMGASVSGLHGWSRALGRDGERRAVAVIGDSTFMHSGVTGLINMAYNGSGSTVIILDNSITGMTGHQQNPTTGYNIKGEPAGKIDLETLCRSVGIRRVSVVDPYDLAQCERTLREELDSEEPSVIISRRPCALLKYVKPKPPLVVGRDKCKKCKACMKLGCPAVSMRDEGASVDPTLCVGCGVCVQLCKFDAIERVDGSAEA